MPIFGSGVAGAIHSAAGPELEDYCEPYAPLPFGAALVTPAFKLPNKYVIHTRAAHYLNDDEAEGVLTKCVYSVVDAANKNAITSIAVPAIGTGVFKFPKELTAEIMADAFRACESSSSLQVSCNTTRYFNQNFDQHSTLCLCDFGINKFSWS